MSDPVRAVTPPREEPGRPRVVTAAIVLWTVLGVLLVGTALLFALAPAIGTADPATGVGSLVLTCLLYTSDAADE